MAKKRATKPANKKSVAKAKPKAKAALKAAPKKAAAKKAAPKKGAGKKAAPRKAAAKAAAPVKAAVKAKQVAKAKAAAPAKPKKVAPVKASPVAAPETSIGDLAGKAMIIQIVGDAEAYFFDFTQLDQARREELIAHHLAAFDRRKQAEGKPDWPSAFIPVALLGESMPPPVRQQFDLSAPHEGVLLHHPQSGALLYAASKDADKLAIIAPDLETLSPQPSVVAETFEPDTYAYDVDRTESEGFTLGQIELMMQVAGAALIMI
jgi:hypothetical protein